MEEDGQTLVHQATLEGVPALLWKHSAGSQVRESVSSAEDLGT